MGRKTLSPQQTPRMHQHLPGLPLPFHVEQDHLIDVVPIVQVMRSRLVEPARLTRIGVASEDPGGPFVVARTLIGIPGSRITGTVIGACDRV